MKQYSLLIFAAFAGLFFQCKSQKYTPETFPERQIIFGEGGGFSGVVTEYILLENGQLFKHSSLKPGEYEPLKRLKKKATKAIFDRLAELRLHKFDIDHPGNLYYFIRITDPEIDHTITWGAADYVLREEIMDFYKSLRNLLRKDA
ncbi:MAG: hypothetical protein D6714_04770 [Bacteroidetes bacterium]|nr:MAG: hypothetical protein D6714_04770 [Bacteroidota bacterium]